jgi:S-adenosylmethionine decarboxylase
MACSSSTTGFEAFERRLELSFSVEPEKEGLRALSKSQLEEILEPTKINIISFYSNEFVDSYLFSESSLFIYPHKLILKTCGKIKLLRSIPPLLKVAGSLYLSLRLMSTLVGTTFFLKLNRIPTATPKLRFW